jgi:hypothetical protein
MTREDIIKMAREAGLYVGRNISGVQLVGSSYEEGGLLVHLAVEELERFAALVAAHERKACIEIIETYRIPVGNSPSGELACEWTYRALHEIRDDIRERSEQ